MKSKSPTALMERTNREALASTKKKKCDLCQEIKERKDIIKCFDPRIPIRKRNQHTKQMWCCDDCYDEYLYV